VVVVLVVVHENRTMVVDKFFFGAQIGRIGEYRGDSAGGVFFGAFGPVVQQATSED
jgi:hypothetical protein